MRLTSKPRAGSSLRQAPRALTTETGRSNPNRQVVVARTGMESQARSGQTVYRLRCGDCAHEYGCSGLDIKSRLCPACQGGTPGEPLPEPLTRSLFAELS